MMAEVQKTKKIPMSHLELVKQKDGSRKAVLTHTVDEIPDLGREHDMCNVCGWSTYPECMKECRAYLPPDEQRRLANEDRAAGRR